MLRTASIIESETKHGEEQLTMELNGVKMMPYGLVSCQINDEELRVIELSSQGFAIRAASPIKGLEAQPEKQLNSLSCSVTLHFYHLKESRYITVELNKFEVAKVSRQEFYLTYTLLTESDEYRQQVQTLLTEYGRYVDLKLNYDDGEVSEALTGYPAKEDDSLLSSYEEIQNEWAQLWRSGTKEQDYSCELAVSLDHESCWEKYLLLPIDSYLKEFWEYHGLTNHPLTKNKVTRIYVGNQFCHHLFPTKQQLIAVLEKAKNEGLAVTIVFSYLREQLIEQTKNTIDLAGSWLREHLYHAEIVVNDWGMTALLKEYYDCMTPVLGTLLNKRRKDPRYEYKCGFDESKQELAKNALNDPEFQEYLSKEHHIRRYEFESCGYQMIIPNGAHSLHVPFYQTNTSQFCPLYAKVTTNDRGKQKYVDHCPGYCSQYVFAYPKHLKMIGRYNSIFGMDETIFRDSGILQDYRKQGIDRIVVDLM